MDHIAIYYGKGETQMPRFFLDKDALQNETVTVYGDDASHIALSLRMAVGESLTLCDNEGFDYLCEITSVTRECVVLTVKERLPSASEPPYFCRLFQCLPKGEKFETVIQKAVECGVSEIVPVQSSRCIAVVKDSAAEKKLIRWNRIAEEACKQSGRGRLVKVLPPLSYREALSSMASADNAFLCYENENGLTLTRHLDMKETPNEIAFLVGPEGGLSPDEINLAKEKGIPSVSLGKRILRSETAAPFVLAVLTAKYEL